MHFRLFRFGSLAILNLKTSEQERQVIDFHSATHKQLRHTHTWHTHDAHTTHRAHTRCTHTAHTSTGRGQLRQRSGSKGGNERPTADTGQSNSELSGKPSGYNKAFLLKKQILGQNNNLVGNCAQRSRLPWKGPWQEEPPVWL